MPLVYLLITLIAATGFADVMAKRCTWPGFVTDCLIFLTCGAIIYSVREGSFAVSGDLIVLSFVFAALAFLWWFISTRYPPLWFAVPIIRERPAHETRPPDNCR